MISTVNIRNKKAGYQFALSDRFTAGIQLTGTEIKSIRDGKASINEAYCAFSGEELFVINMHIAEYKYDSSGDHNPLRKRKLLLKKNELKRMLSKTETKGFAVIPVHLFINARGYAKVEIALAKGKKLQDKRQDIKRRDLSREYQRHFKK